MNVLWEFVEFLTMQNAKIHIFKTLRRTRVYTKQVNMFSPMIHPSAFNEREKQGKTDRVFQP